MISISPEFKNEPKTRLALLGTLGHLHTEPLRYDLACLRSLVEALEPDLLVVEVEPEAWERGSEHPLGRAIVERAEARQVALWEPQEFQAVRGKGVTASVNGDRVLVGSRRLMAEHGLDPAPLEADLVRLEEEAKTDMLVAVNGTLAGVVAVADTLKEDSVDAIRELGEMGLQTGHHRLDASCAGRDRHGHQFHHDGGQRQPLAKS